MSITIASALPPPLIAVPPANSSLPESLRSVANRTPARPGVGDTFPSSQVMLSLAGLMPVRGSGAAPGGCGEAPAPSAPLLDAFDTKHFPVPGMEGLLSLHDAASAPPEGQIDEMPPSGAPPAYSEVLPLSHTLG